MIIRFFFAFVAALLLCSCSPMEALVGGYGQTRRLTPSDKQLFAAATASIKGVDYKPVKVATQVVAGTNYRFLCKAREPQQERYHAVVVIYKPLPGQGEPRITSIEREPR